MEAMSFGSGGSSNKGYYGSASDVTVVSDGGNQRRHRRTGSVQVLDGNVYNISVMGGGMLSRAPEHPPPPPPNVLPPEPPVLPPPPPPKDLPLPPPPSAPPPAPPSPRVFQGFILRYPRDEQIYNTIPDPIYDDCRHNYEKIRDDQIPWHGMEAHKGGYEYRPTNTYAPEPPKRTSSLKKKHPPSVLPKPSITQGGEKKIQGNKQEQKKCCTGRCRTCAILLFILFILGGIAAAVALYFLGFFTEGPSADSTMDTETMSTLFPTLLPTMSLGETSTVVEKTLATTFATSTEPIPSAPLFLNSTSCDDILLISKVETGPYFIKNPFPRGRAQSGSFLVYCDVKNPNTAWMLIQRRTDPRIDFNHSWADYEGGFGNVRRGDFWMGNKYIHELTKSSRSRFSLRVEIRDKEGGFGWVEYEDFRIDQAGQGYALQIGNYRGNVANALLESRGFKFSTYDRDNDYDNDRHCAKEKGGGWWFLSCGKTFLNGIPGDESERGMIWVEKAPNIISVEMKIREIA